MVRIFVSSRRPCDSDALATSSYETTFAQPLSAATLVSAAVRVVLPWSMCPIVPTFTCRLLRSNFSLAMSSTFLSIDVVVVRLPPSRSASADKVACGATADSVHLACQPKLATRAKAGADVQNRTGDLVLTKDAL